MSNVQTYHCHDCDEKDGALVVGWSEDPDVDLCPDLDEVCDGVGPKPFRRRSSRKWRPVPQSFRT